MVALRAEAVFKPKGRAGAAFDSGEINREAEVDAVAEGGIAELERYLETPNPQTVLVFVAADIHRGTRIVKALLRRATVVEFWGLKTEREAQGRDLPDVARRAGAYVAGRVREAGVTIAMEAEKHLLEHAGTDIATLRNDVDRVLLYTQGRTEVTLEDVRAVVGGAVAVDDWALTRSIEQRDVASALRHLAWP